MRTQGGLIELWPNGKWSISFETFVGLPGAENKLHSIVTRPMFDNEDEAYDAQNKVLNYLEVNGLFPSMNEREQCLML